MLALIKLTAISLSLLGCFTIYGASVFNSTAAPSTPQTTPVQFKTPLGIPEVLWRHRIPVNNPVTADKVALGEDLYFDKRLSHDMTLSCATCHDPASAFADFNVTAVGTEGRAGVRNAPTILNAMFSESQFWDGRAPSLEEQIKQPLINPAEMGMKSTDMVVARVVAVPEYRQRFRRTFRREGITIDTIAKAIATYERMQLSGNSPFDRFRAGDSTAITEAQKRGWALFQHKAQCIVCHTFNASSPFFTDFKFHNTGIAMENKNFTQVAGHASRMDTNSTDASAVNLFAHTEGFSELGRFLVTKQSQDVGAFKTPTLRDIELTTPYMHNGSEKTLIDVVRFYNKGGNANPNLDQRMRPLRLTDEEMNDLVEFMRGLTSDDVLRQAQSSKPQTRTPVALPHFRVGKNRSLGQ